MDATTTPKPKEDKLWGGRFEASVTDAGEKFSESVSFDKALYKHDIASSRAHAAMLAHQRQHTARARRDREGDLGGGVRVEGGCAHEHRGNSHGLDCSGSLHVIDKIVTRINQLQVSLVNLAIKNEGLIVLGYSHLQRAQPVLLQHLLLSYVEQLERDTSRLTDCKDRMKYCPLGACALVGTGLSINRFLTSDALGFIAPMRNNIDAVSERDFVLEFLSLNSIIAIHLSRLGEEWILWASEQFGFLTPSDSVFTRSNIMPQKKNPDPMELIRGMSARIVGDLVTLLVLCKRLPQSYNRDLQEDRG